MQYMATVNPRYRVVSGQVCAWIGSEAAQLQVRAWPEREVDASGDFLNIKQEWYRGGRITRRLL